MIRVLGKSSQHSIAPKLFDCIPLEEFRLDLVLGSMTRQCNVILDVYGRKGRSWSKILEILDEMKSRRVSYDEFTYSTVISVCGREGLLTEASEFFEQLKFQGYVLGTVTYNSLLQAYGKAGNYPAALRVLKEMEDNDCPADGVTYNELVATYRAGFYEQGAAVLDTMPTKGIMPNSITYTTVINGYGNGGKEDEALMLFQRMKKFGCALNVCTILGMLGRKSRMEDYVSQVYTEMKKSGVEADRETFNTMIAAYGRCG